MQSTSKSAKFIILIEYNNCLITIKFINSSITLSNNLISKKKKVKTEEIKECGSSESIIIIEFTEKAYTFTITMICFFSTNWL
jgi:hypothetical protein